MKYCRFRTTENDFRYGLIENQGGVDLVTRVGHTIEDLGLGLIPQQAHGAHPSVPLHLDEVDLLAPVTPSKIICIGRNYRDHAAELGNEVPAEPLLFLKPPSSLAAPGDEVRRPAASNRVDYEGELGVVIGKECSHLGDHEDVRPFILGYTVVNDVTARDLQKKDVQFTRAKGFDTFCPVGPFVTDEVDPWSGLTVETKVNGEVRQHGNTRDFIFPLDVIIRFISQVMTLFPGDLISTGTPAGVGPVQSGDVMEVSVEGIGTLRNPVR